MRPMFLSVAAVLILAATLSCGSDSGDTKAATIVLINRAGTVAPGYWYEETITVDGQSMHLTRTGGDQVITGDWDVTLSQGEVSDLSMLSRLIDPQEDGDTVAGDGPIGGGLLELHLADAVFYNGWLEDPTTSQSSYHSFSVDVKNLADYIGGLIDAYGYGRRYP